MEIDKKMGKLKLKEVDAEADDDPLATKEATKNHFASKYYSMEETTVKEFWLEKPKPPTMVEIFPVGHPQNSGLQTVWKASEREVKYFEAKKFFVPTVPCENVLPAKDRNFFDALNSNVLYCGRFLLLEQASRNVTLIKSWIPEKKHMELQEVTARYDSKFWTRFTESFGGNIAGIALSLARRSKNTKLRVLILAGSNFQGASCVVAARHMAAMGCCVFICCIKNGGSETPFEGSSPRDLNYEDISVVFDLKAIKQEKFHVVMLGADDFRSPTSSIYIYRDWLQGVAVMLIEPPMIAQSYYSLMDGICREMLSSLVSVTLVYAIRPAPVVMNEKAAIFVVSFPTCPEYPPVGNLGSNEIKPFTGKAKKRMY